MKFLSDRTAHDRDNRISSLLEFMPGSDDDASADFHGAQPEAGFLELKVFFLGRQSIQATIQLLLESPAPHITAVIVRHVASTGAIHSAQPVIMQP